MRLLVPEDEAKAAAHLHSRLRESGYSVDGAGSGLGQRWVHAGATVHRGLTGTSDPAPGR